METFEDVYRTLCRVCLNPGNRDNMVSLHNNASVDGLSSFGKAAGLIANIYIANDFLPNLMCGQCLKLLTKALIFKKTCEESQRSIEKLLSVQEFSEQEFQKDLVEYALFTSILSDGSSKGKPRYRSVPPKDSKHSKRAKNIDKTSDLHQAQIENEPRLPKNSKKYVEKSQEIQENDLFTDNFQNQPDPDFDDSLDEKNQSLDNDIPDSMKAAIPDECKPLETKETIESFTDDKKNVSEISVSVNAMSKEENIDEILDAMEDVILMDNKTFVMLTHPCKKEKTSNKRNSKSEDRKKTKEHVCQYCNKNYSSKSSLKLHIERHTGLYGFVCEFCAQRFATKSELQYHLNSSHDAGTKFICDECGYQAFRKYELQEHVRVHTGEKPYSCNKCERKFRLYAVWKCHNKICNTEKTVPCKECSKKFHTNYDVKVHMNSVHDRRYMYGCDFCDIKYAKIGTVRRHLQEQHGIARSAQGKVKKISLDNEKEPKRKKRKKWVPLNDLTCDD